MVTSLLVDFLISYQPCVKINVTSKVLLETARLASVLPIAPPRKTTGPIQVEDTQSFFGSQPANRQVGKHVLPTGSLVQVIA